MNVWHLFYGDFLIVGDLKKVKNYSFIFWHSQTYHTELRKQQNEEQNKEKNSEKSTIMDYKK